MPSKKPAQVVSRCSGPDVSCSPYDDLPKKGPRHIPWEPGPTTLWIKNPVWNAWQARGIARMMPGFKVRPVR